MNLSVLFKIQFGKMLNQFVLLNSLQSIAVAIETFNESMFIFENEGILILYFTKFSNSFEIPFDSLPIINKPFS